MIIIDTTIWNESRFGGKLADVPAGKMAFIWKSEDGSGKINKLTKPACDSKYWKPSNGKIVEMTTTEKAAKDQAIADAQAQIEADKKNFMVAATKIDKAMCLAFLDAINTLRTNASLPAVTVDQLKTAIANKYDGLE